MINDKNKRNEIFDILKVVMSFCVILLHSIQHAGALRDNPFRLTDNMIGLLYAFCFIAVPIFYMISGLLLLQKEESKEKWIKRILKTFAQLAIWSLITYVLVQYSYQDTFFDNAKLFFSKFIHKYVEGPFWYLYSYIVILLLLPIIRKVVSVINPKEFVYLLIVYLVIYALPYTINIITGWNTFTYFQTFMNDSIYWVLIFMSGFYLYNNYQNINKKKWAIGGGL